MEISRLFILGIMVLLPCVAEAIHVPYIPQVVNYSVNDYNAGNQNWAVSQGADEKMYFGNNRGLLQFDGIRWNLYKLPNNIAVRSVYVAPGGRIYVGSFEEFGYFDTDDKNRLIYYSLKSLVTDYKFFNDEIWTICEYKGAIYFQSFHSFFVYDGNQVRRGSDKCSPLFFYSLDGELYAQFISGGFAKAEGDGFRELFSREQVNNDDVIAALPYDEKILLVTVMNGFYLYDNGRVTPWNIPAGKMLNSSIANRAVMLKDSSYVVGTISDGLIAIDKSGNLLWRINRDNHLINNTVLGVFTDNTNNLWVALDNGIAHVQTNSPIYLYEPLDVQIGMVHDMVIDNKDIYMATNQGVYLFPEVGKYPQLMPGTEELTWFITNMDNQLIVGHNRGTLMIENKKATGASHPTGGGTALRKCILHGKEVLLQVSYNNLSVFTRNQAGRWQFSHTVEGFDNLIKSLEVDPSGNIWVSHMYKGMYRIRLDETLHKLKEMEYIGKLDSLNDEGIISVMKLRGRIVFTDGKKFYTYEDLSSRIVPYDVLNKEFPELSDTYRIVPCNNDLFWFIRNTEYVLLSYEAGHFLAKLRIPFTLFNNPTIEDRGNIYVDSDGISYFCLNGGFARYNPARTLADQEKIPLTLSSIKIYNRSDNKKIYLPCRGADTPDSGVSAELDYKYNNISFEFSFPDYSGRHSHIRYKLDGFDNDWIEGTPDFTKNYSNLPYGDFVLHAVVQDSAGNDLSDFSYPFTVKHPFYRSLFAFILYFVLLLSVLLASIKVYVTKEVARKNKLVAEQQRQQEEQLKIQEQLITKLENEKLENELSYKSKELASATLSVISHNEFLDGLKKEMQTQQLSGNNTKRFFDKLIRMIDDSITKDDEWAVFQTNFDRIHEHFFVKLKERYPDLTSGDLRMCALLRLNMPTKDMASMQYLSVRGVEAARYRLRKKLNLPEGQSLVDFMIQFS